jgi:hypothetical protein
VIRRMALVLVAVGLIAVAVWLPREEDVAAGGEAALAEIPPGVEFLAERGTPLPPFVEGWELSFPDRPPVSQRLTLHIGAAAGQAAPGRLVAGPGDPTARLERVALALGDTTSAVPALPPAGPIELQMNLLGEHLSAGHGDVGETVIAGAFVATPAGDWRVYRLTLGEGGPQCFFGVSAAARAAVLLPRALEDGPAIQARFRSLLARHAPKPS